MSGKYWLIFCESILCIQRCMKLQGKKRDQYSIVASQAFNSAAHVGVHGLPFLSDLACSISVWHWCAILSTSTASPKITAINKQNKRSMRDRSVWWQCMPWTWNLVKSSSPFPGISLKIHLSGVNSSIGTASFFASSPPYTLSSSAFVVLAATNNSASSKSSALESN